MDLAVGSIIEGKVTGITKFGAFIALPENKSGMVHISEVANSFVNNINDFLSEGQLVKVKVISIDKEGRINLSIKKAAEPPPNFRPRPQGARSFENRGPSGNSSREPQTFEDKLKQFMQDSQNRMSDLKYVNDRKGSSRRGTGKGK